MSEEIKSVDAKIDELEAGVKKYASKDTVIAIGGYEFTPAKLMIAFTLVSSILGGLYGTFEVYKDYQSMKKKIAEYISPDLTEVYKKLAVIEENTQKTSDYTRDIKGDLKNDIRRLEGVVENVERSSKQTSRETDQAVKEARDEVRQVRKEAENTAKALERDMASATKALNNEVDRKIQRALDNPLAK
jgi:DNA-directed RNA polymerase beta' subunit